MNLYREIDTREVLPAITAPTLVLHRSKDRLAPVTWGRYLGDNIPGARYVELPGRDHLMAAGDQDGLLDEVEEFLTGMRREREPDRVLATVLFGDIVGSHRARPPQFGDAAPGATSWQAHDARVRGRARTQPRPRASRRRATASSPPSTARPGPIRCACAIR